MYILQPSGSPPSSPLFTPKRVHARSSRFWETDESSCTESDAEEGDTSTLAIIVIRTLPGAAVGQLVTHTLSHTHTHSHTHSLTERKKRLRSDSSPISSDSDLRPSRKRPASGLREPYRLRKQLPTRQPLLPVAKSSPSSLKLKSASKGSVLYLLERCRRKEERSKQG